MSRDLWKLIEPIERRYPMIREWQCDRCLKWYSVFVLVMNKSYLYNCVPCFEIRFDGGQLPVVTGNFFE